MCKKGVFKVKEISMDTIEMGNLLFGHSRGAFSINREEYEPMFQRFLADAGFDIYGLPCNEATGNHNLFIRNSEDSVEAENDIFIIRPYYWGEDERIMNLPNFVYKPKGIEIRWYKYALRDAYCSHNLSVKEFEEMLEECMRGLKG